MISWAYIYISLCNNKRNMLMKMCLTNTLFVLIFARINFRATRALRVILCVFIFAHHELSITSRVLIFAQGHFTRNFFSIIYLKQMKREAKFKEYGI